MAGELQILLHSASSSDLILILGLALCYPAARWILEGTVFAWLARYWLVPPALHKGKLPGKLSLQILKMKEAMWKLSCYGLFMVLAVTTLWGQEWARRGSTREFWEGWPHQEGTAPLQWICRLEIAYYISGVVMLARWEVSRKDESVMMLHHIVTLIIMGSCYMCNYTRACCVAALLHDTTDVIMEAAKISSYIQLQALANALFSLFLLCWLSLRMVAFPWLIMHSTLFEITEVLGPGPPFFWIINVPILVLYCIQFYWLALILKVALQMLLNGNAKDVREEED